MCGLSQSIIFVCHCLRDASMRSFAPDEMCILWLVLTRNNCCDLRVFTMPVYQVLNHHHFLTFFTTLKVCASVFDAIDKYMLSQICGTLKRHTCREMSDWLVWKIPLPFLSSFYPRKFRRVPRKISYSHPTLIYKNKRPDLNKRNFNQ